MNTILLVEDDEPLGSTLSERLQREGYQVSWTQTRAAAEELLKQQSFSLCLLDIGLPDGSGLDLAREIKLGADFPIIFLTAMNSAEYRLEGYELGAEEFIPKPFFIKELLLRIERVLKRSDRSKTTDLGAIKINWERMSLTFENGLEEFPAARDFKLLAMLIHSAPQVLTREQIIKELWSEESTANERSIDNAIVRLRQLLRRGQADYIRSVRGLGYHWLNKETSLGAAN